MAKINKTSLKNMKKIQNILKKKELNMENNYHIIQQIQVKYLLMN